MKGEWSKGVAKNQPTWKGIKSTHFTTPVGTTSDQCEEGPLPAPLAVKEPA